MSDRPHIGVATLLWRGDELLLGERIMREPDSARQKICWQFPGGHPEPGESMTECAVRETREETGIRLLSPRCVAYTDRCFQLNGRNYHALYVSGECAYDAVPEVKEPEKCRRWQWFHYENLPAPLFQPVLLLLDQLSAQQSSLPDIRL